AVLALPYFMGRPDSDKKKTDKGKGNADGSTHYPQLELLIIGFSIPVLPIQAEIRR
ncbi:hypothetical protein LCGC14_2915090, partial [marine sediment metagenome]